jgi:hypothetical protein
MIINHEDGSPSLAKNVDDYLPEPALAIRLACNCDIPSILPVAFYHLSCISVYYDCHKLYSEGI